MTNDTTTLSGSLQELGETMASNLVAMGVSGADASDGLTTLAQNILNIAPAVGGITPTVSIDLSKSPTIVCRGANLVINALVNADYDDESVADVDLKGYLQGATITFKNGNTDLGYAVSDSDGIATLVVQNVQQGNYSITANFDGTGTDYESATSDALTFTVNDYPTITLTADKTTVAVGETVTFTVTAMYNNSPVVGYPIQLYKDGSSLGSSYRDITNNEGECSFTITPAVAGVNTYNVNNFSTTNITITTKDYVYVNTGVTDQSSDFNQSYATVTHNTDDYSIITSQGAYNPITITPLTGISLDNCKLSFDLNLGSSQYEFGFGLAVGTIKSDDGMYSGGDAFLGINDYRRVTYKNYGASKDSYYNISLYGVYGKWTHWEYVFENDQLYMSVYDGETLIVSYDISLPASALSREGNAYRLSPFWASGT